MWRRERALAAAWTARRPLPSALPSLLRSEEVALPRHTSSTMMRGEAFGFTCSAFPSAPT
jgi:hypothetical protein